MNPTTGLDGAALARLCRERRIVREAIWVPRVASTQDEARRLARSGGPGVLVVAGEQSHGRGRLGRTWWSPAGRGLYLSLVLTPRRARDEWAFLSPLAGIALRQALREAAGVECGIKWPNDLLTEGQKIAGILAEAGAEPWVVIGVGVNLLQDHAEFPDELQGKATSVAIERVRDGSTEGRVQIGAAALLDAYLRAMETWLERFESSGAGACLDALRSASLLMGREVTIRPAHDRDPIRGRVVDLGAGGELILEPLCAGVEAVRLAVVSGQIVAIEPPLWKAGGTS